ncbi:MAG: hypothetical protein RID91_20280 [Azospirillaceae bacterium]
MHQLERARMDADGLRVIGRAIVLIHNQDGHILLREQSADPDADRSRADDEREGGQFLSAMHDHLNPFWWFGEWRIGSTPWT